jgi:hypothetical protein
MPSPAPLILSAAASAASWLGNFSALSATQPTACLLAAFFQSKVSLELTNNLMREVTEMTG